MSVNGYKVIDFDGHIFLTESDLAPYFAKAYYGRPVEIVGISGLFARGDTWHWRVTARNTFEVPEGKNAPAEDPDVHGWIDYLDHSGVDATVLYPSRLFHLSTVHDVDFAVAIAQAYNNFLFDSFTKHDPRIFGAALLPLQNGKVAAAELRRAVKELGFVTGIMMVASMPKSLSDESFYPLYEEAQKLGVTLAVHSGSDPGLGFDRYFRHMAEVHSLNHGFCLMIHATSALFSGIFDDFPGLQMAFLEGGSNWLIYLMERIDPQYERKKKRTHRTLKLGPPSEYIKNGRLFWHAEIDKPSLPYTLGRTRNDVFFYASDFPHATRDDVIEELKEFIERDDLDDATKRSILSGAAERVYHFEKTVGARKQTAS
jgi:uncharacterized protein